jgi:hypothetical protein
LLSENSVLRSHLLIDGPSPSNSNNGILGAVQKYEGLVGIGKTPSLLTIENKKGLALTEAIVPPHVGLIAF